MKKLGIREPRAEFQTDMRREEDKGKRIAAQIVEKPEEAGACYREAVEVTRVTIIQNWRSVEAVAQALLDRKELSGDEVRQIIEEAEDVDIFSDGGEPEGECQRDGRA